MMWGHASLFEYDLEYREFLPGKWLPTKKSPLTNLGHDPQLVERAELDDSDILVPTYPKTGLVPATWVPFPLPTYPETGLVVGHLGTCTLSAATPNKLGW